MSWLKNIFKKEEIIPLDPSILEVDMHSHLIPGIDDGAANMDETMGMLRRFKSLGYRKVITTPHIKLGSFDNTTEIIRSGYDEVKKVMKAEGLDLEFDVAAEYFFDYSFMEKIESGDLMTFSNNHILVEYAFGQPPVGQHEMFFQLQMKGLKPILAHFERYPYYHGTVKDAQELRDKGIKIQVNLGSFFGHYGPQIQKQAELMLKEGAIDLVSSDCHRMEHLELFEQHLGHKNIASLRELKLYNSKL